MFKATLAVALVAIMAVSVHARVVPRSENVRVAFTFLPRHARFAYDNVDDIHNDLKIVLDTYCNVKTLSIDSGRTEALSKNELSFLFKVKEDAVRAVECLQDPENHPGLYDGNKYLELSNFKVVKIEPLFYYTEMPAVTTDDSCDRMYNPAVMRFDTHSTTDRKLTSYLWSDKRQYIAWKLRDEIALKCNVDPCDLVLGAAWGLCIVDDHHIEIIVNEDIADDLRTCVETTFVKAAHTRLQNAYRLASSSSQCNFDA
jgi:hypothetical protein